MLFLNNKNASFEKKANLFREFSTRFWLKFSHKVNSDLRFLLLNPKNFNNESHLSRLINIGENRVKSIRQKEKRVKISIKSVKMLLK